MDENIKLKLRQTLSLIGLMLLSLTVLMVALCVVPIGSDLSVEMLKLLQLLQSIVIFILPALFWSKLYTGSLLKGLYLLNKPKMKDVWIVIVLMFVAVPAINLMGYLNSQIEFPAFMADMEKWMQQLEQNAKELTFKLLGGTCVGDFFFNLFVIALIPALGEEMTFRGVLIQIFSSNNRKNKASYPHIAVWTCAVIFSLIHFQFYGFVPRMLIGALFGYLLCYSGSLWLPIVAHFANNAIVVATSYIYQISTNKPLSEMKDLGTEHTWWIGLICFILASLGFYLLLTPKKNE